MDNDSSDYEYYKGVDLDHAVVHLLENVVDGIAVLKKEAHMACPKRILQLGELVQD